MTYRRGKTAQDLHALLLEQYADEPFIHVLPFGKVPQSRHVRGSNMTFIGVVATIFALSFRSDVAQTPGGDLVPLANAIFRDYAFPFEVASVLLLAAMIGAIALVKRGDD